MRIGKSGGALPAARYTWLHFAILKALGLSVAACDDNLGPAGSDLDPYDSTRYHHDPLEHHMGVIDDLHSKGARRSACGSTPAPERTRCLA